MHKVPRRSAAVLLLLVTWASRVHAGEPNATVAQSSARDPLSDFAVAEARLEREADVQPNDPERWYRLAELYSEKVRNDRGLSSNVARQYVMSGLKFASRALMLDSEHRDALVLSSTLLLQQAEYEKDSALKKSLIARAGTYKRRAGGDPKPAPRGK